MKNDRQLARTLAGISERNVQKRLAQMEGKLTNLTISMGEYTKKLADTVVKMKALQSELATITLEDGDDDV